MNKVSILPTNQIVCTCREVHWLDNSFSLGVGWLFRVPGGSFSPESSCEHSSSSKHISESVCESLLPKDRRSSSRKERAAEALLSGGWLGLLLWLPWEPARCLGGGGRTGMGKAEKLVETGFKDWEEKRSGWGGLGVSSPVRSISVSVVSDESQQNNWLDQVAEYQLDSKIWYKGKNEPHPSHCVQL